MWTPSEIVRLIIVLFFVGITIFILLMEFKDEIIEIIRELKSK